MACPDDITLASFIGGLTTTESAAIEAHLADCAACRAAIAILAQAELSERSVPTPVVRRLRRGDRVGRYEIEDCIGVGGMGVVYAAHDPKLDRKVALKVVRGAGSEVAQERLLGEAQAMARLAHPNVVTLHDVIAHAHDVVLTMEFVPGQTLADWLTTSRSWREIFDALVQAARGLEAAHKAQLVHRDFKPTNVFVRDDGRVQVGDFGLARPTDSTAEAGVQGTPRYMAPEQRHGKPTASSDQYSFCVVLGEALRDTSHPDVFDEVISRGRSESASERFSSMTELLAALEAASRVSDPDPASRVPDPDPSIEPVPRDPPIATPRRRTSIAIVGLVAVLSVGVLIAVKLRGNTPSSASAADRWQAGLLLGNAKDYLARGMPGPATTMASEAIRLDPALATARYYRALALYENSDHEAARSELAILTSELPEPERLLADALRLRLAGRFPEAESVLRDSASRFPDDPQVRFQLGDWAFHAGRLEIAEQELRVAIRLQATFVPAHRHLMWTLDTLGRSRDAAAAAREWARHAPSRVATVGLVDALCVAGEFDEASKVLDAAGPSPEFDAARADLAIVRGDLAGARKLFAPHVAPENSLEEQRGTRWSLLWLEGRAGRFSAIDRLRDEQRALGKAEELELAALFWRAMRDPTTTLPAVPERADPRIRTLLHAYLQTGAFERARALLTSDPDPFVALLIDAEEARQQGKLEAALALYRRAARGSRAVRIWAHYGSSRSMFALGRWQDVVADDLVATPHAFSPRGFHDAVYPQAVLLQARALEKLGERARARGRYEELARLWSEADPDIPELREVSEAISRLR